MKNFMAANPGSNEGKTNTWLTPLDLINKLGEFDLDPCGFPSHNTAKEIICLPENGLEKEWFGRVWLNPPYGKTVNLWLKKLQSHRNGIALIFGRTDTKWFHSLDFDAIGFIKGRIKFLNENFVSKNTANSPSILLAFGKNNTECLKKVCNIVCLKTA